MNKRIKELAEQAMATRKHVPLYGKCTILKWKSSQS